MIITKLHCYVIIIQILNHHILFTSDCLKPIPNLNYSSSLFIIKTSNRTLQVSSAPTTKSLGTNLISEKHTERPCKSITYLILAQFQQFSSNFSKIPAIFPAIPTKSFQNPPRNLTLTYDFQFCIRLFNVLHNI